MDHYNVVSYGSDAFVLLVLIGISYRIYWESRRNRKQMQAQIDLLAQIAAAQGVSTEKIAEIVAKVKLETK